jgi:hypothetical protein
LLAIRPAASPRRVGRSEQPGGGSKGRSGSGRVGRSGRAGCLVRPSVWEVGRYGSVGRNRHHSRKYTRDTAHWPPHSALLSAVHAPFVAASAENNAPPTHSHTVRPGCAAAQLSFRIAGPWAPLRGRLTFKGVRRWWPTVRPRRPPPGSAGPPRPADGLWPRSPTRMAMGRIRSASERTGSVGRPLPGPRFPAGQARIGSVGRTDPGRDRARACGRVGRSGTYS